MKISHSRRGDSTQLVAGNGLIDRRALLGRGILIAGATTTGVTTSFTGAAANRSRSIRGVSRSALPSRPTTRHRSMR